jgi:hypothetical protein
METMQTPIEGLTFEKVWAALMENREQMKETDRRLQETDRIVKETALRQQETDRQMKETDKKISRLGGRIGDLIEHFAAANVIEKFRALGYEFTRSSRNITIEDKNRRSLAEVDIFLEDGEFVMAVEVKTNLVPVDVTEHLHRMDVLRTDADRRGDKRKYLGAIAAALAGEGVKKLALDNGFYVLTSEPCGVLRRTHKPNTNLFVLEQQGDNVRISAPANKRVW